VRSFQRDSAGGAKVGAGAKVGTGAGTGAGAGTEDAAVPRLASVLLLLRLLSRSAPRGADLAPTPPTPPPSAGAGAGGATGASRLRVCCQQRREAVVNRGSVQ
jgi:hypothetical protein